MQITVDRPSMYRASRSAKPVLAAVLATGAGVTGFAHPLVSPRLSPIPQTAPDLSAHGARLEVSLAATLTPPHPFIPRPRESTPRLAPPPQPAPPPGVRVLEPTFDPAASAPHLTSVTAAVTATTVPAPGGITASAELAGIAAPAASEAPPALTLPPAAEDLTGSIEALPPALEEQAAPADEPTDGNGTTRFAASRVAQGSLGLMAPPEPTRRPALMMPAAELKAMMTSEAARRDRPLGSSSRLVEAIPPSAPPAKRVTPPQAAQPALAASSTNAASLTTIKRIGQSERGIQFDVTARVNGDAAGTLPLLITGETISVRLSDVLSLLEPMMEPAQFAALSTASSAGEFVTLNHLRASGIAVRFDARDQLILGRR